MAFVHTLLKIDEFSFIDSLVTGHATGIEIWNNQPIEISCHCAVSGGGWGLENLRTMGMGIHIKSYAQLSKVSLWYRSRVK
jgi:hypothetical protein